MKRKRGETYTTIQKTGHKPVRQIEPVEGQGAASVSFSMGATLEVGDHEFVRFDVGVTIPCGPDELVRTYLRAQRFVNKRIRVLNREVERER